ncbi:MAG: UDP-glucose--hexose-1-phosphate uridylyltransferase [Clostridium sp.]|nr:UDP-glucose--hexose-1-phosphate uridylyltransferase [Clostridium sp.]
MKDINYEIDKLVKYSIKNLLIDKCDKIYATNKLIEVLGVKEYSENSYGNLNSMDIDLGSILDNMISWYEKENNYKFPNIESKDLFDTKIMGCVTMAPSLFRHKYFNHYNLSPYNATNFHYDFSIKSNYIRRDRVEKDLKWKYNSNYGEIDITINLSKPEKDPKLIAEKTKEKESKYPECFLCKENEGFPGNLFHPARNNLRIVPMTLASEDWFMQYSPYVYYNEHCIVFNSEHAPMKINKKTFRRLLEFVRLYPHYTVGSNADLPIVGGSILSHDHYQGGNYDFAMSKAEEIEKPYFKKHNVSLSLLKWPMSVIRLKGKSIYDLEEASDFIFKKWIKYSDEELNIVSHTDETRHNTVTPIARFKDGLYEMDIILRNNRTDQENPHGIFHAEEKYHNIKRENIGLIECMGLAVLPSRLKSETNHIKEFILGNHKIKNSLDFNAMIKKDEILSMHKNLIDSLIKKSNLNKENIDEIIEEEIGFIFLKVLEDCGVFKNDIKGFDKFLEVIYEN